LIDTSARKTPESLAAQRLAAKKHLNTFEEDWNMDRESVVEAYLRRRAEALGGVCKKFIPDYARGWPDRVLLLPGGVLCWVETKAEDGVVSAAQAVAHEDLRRLGQRVAVVWTKEEADRLIELLTSLQ
jgi:hypothetical protein